VSFAPLHFLSDFDGVWTEPTREMRAVHDTVVGELARLGGIKVVQMEEHYAAFAHQVMRHPERHGWIIEGQITSYVDEDVFAMPTAVGQLIDQGKFAGTAHFREAILREWTHVIDFLDHCYHSTCDRFRALYSHDLAPGAARVLQWLMERGVDITFATNAPAEKVIQWFHHQGFDVADARVTTRKLNKLRVYGRAGKQWLGTSGDFMDYGGRRVAVDRPQYRQIIEQEKPDLIVGDVLSLDLSLPLAMRKNGESSAPSSIGLMQLTHTPHWATQGVGGHAGTVDWLVPHVTSLPRLITQAFDQTDPTPTIVGASL